MAHFCPHKKIFLQKVTVTEITHDVKIVISLLFLVIPSVVDRLGDAKKIVSIIITTNITKLGSSHMDI